MRIFRRGITNVRLRKRGPSRPPAMASMASSSTSASGASLGIQRPPAMRRDAVTAIVKQFHALSPHQRYRAVARVVQRNRNFNEDIERFFLEADKDKDGLLNRHEFRAFLESRFSLRMPRPHPENESTARPTNHQLKLVMLASAIPFIGFGFVDNIIMLAAGDMIEDHFHETFHISMLCAAALGNTVADVVGLSLGGIIESFVRRIGIPDPCLSKAQARMAVTHWANFIASAGGITVGCILGMFPLLFMNHAKYEQEVILAAKEMLDKAEALGFSLGADAERGGGGASTESGAAQQQQQASSGVGAAALDVAARPALA
ncbi:hypothetical protein P43SY_008579 [Pythium insidiosum]|uniref:EF-hand domain-containing protein n=1 Tax=Pythium insidiosum TaxID=114742 RepID=A0AAD5Q6U5_PYTIN|nr:hypothetical protein P43SY_008579 [Pythium insidiosum]